MTGLTRHRIDGISYLRRVGNGQAIVMLHGIGSNAMSFEPLTKQLPADWDLICWDAPGYGESDPLDTAHPAPADYAGRLDHLVRGLGLERFILLGHSLGALFATAYASKFPDNAAALVLVAPAEGYGIAAGASLPAKAQARLDDLAQAGAAEFAEQRAVKLVYRPQDNPEIVSDVRDAMARINPAGYRQAVCALSAGTLARTSANIRLPSLVLVGVADIITPFEQGEGAHRELVRASPGLPHVIRQISEAGHALPQQRPDVVADEIRSFATQVFGDRPPANRGDNKMNSTKATYNVPPVQRAFKLLRFIAEGNDCGNTSQSAKAVGINRTTLLRLLHTLTTEGMIEPVGTGGGYRLGTGLISLASTAVFSRDLVQVAQPVLKRLAQSLGLSAHLGILEGQHIVYLVRETPNLHLVSNVRVGSRLPAHATTIGRSILSQLEFEHVKAQFAESELFQVTGKTAVTYDALEAQLAEDRAAGMAWSVGNFERNIGSCAVAIRDISAEVVGAINVTGPDHHFLTNGGRRDEIAGEIVRAADQISRQLGHIPPAATGGTSQVRDRERLS